MAENLSSGVEGGVEEEEEGGDSPTNTGEDEEDLWVDVDPTNLGADGNGAEEGTVTRPNIGRQSPLRDLGRLGGRGRRGFWVRRREEQLNKSKKPNVGHGEDSPTKDSKQYRVKRGSNQGLDEGEAEH